MEHEIFTFFFFNDTATTEIYTLSLHDALPILLGWVHAAGPPDLADDPERVRPVQGPAAPMARHGVHRAGRRSEEHTSELQSRQYLVCRLLLEKKKKTLPSA